jgi:geranylgeranyl diphosphate synthase, type II
MRASIPAVTAFDLNRYLLTRRTIIDRALNRYLKTQNGQSQTIRQAMRYGLFPGGKRIRPILTLAAGELFGAKHKNLLPFACAIEMIHAYSLIHDDLPALDDDDFRRGEPTAHKVFGEGMALLAGDGLLTEAFHLMSAPMVTRSLPAASALTLIHEIARAGGVVGLVGGQAFDLEAENNREVDLAAVEYIHVRKTGALILASVRVGAQAAGARAGALRRVSRYGQFLGLAFQIADDLLDMQGQPEGSEASESGRREKKKATYPSVAGWAQARERLEELLQQALQQLEGFGGEAEALRAIAGYVVGRALGKEIKSNMQEIYL